LAAVSKSDREAKGVVALNNVEVNHGEGSRLDRRAEFIYDWKTLI
jgi:hypothetical protein